MKNTLTFLILSGFLFSLSGCNAMHGLGKDIKKVGNSIERKAGGHR
ncbi:MAG: entericidin A/B family lipoprotein [Thiotrichaceae bacterium]|nr:entericidin A/B family lipoprotein [Thiotrichaceae bacterium]